MSLEALVNEAQQQIEEIRVKDAQAYIEAEKPFIIDVREPAELNNGFIPGADNIPRGLLEFKIQNHAEVKDKNRPILVYCQAGMRGVLATATLNQLGYTSVKNLGGGFSKWLQAGMPVAKDPDTW